LTCILLGLVGFATAVDLKTRNFILAFSIGLAFGLGYYGIRTALDGMGGRGLLPSVWAAWAPCALFAVIAFAQLQRLQRVH
jgi:lipopolysaccharide export LptBFGC system permease protein LptF